jgi:hypothetical protein
MLLVGPYKVDHIKSSTHGGHKDQINCDEVISKPQSKVSLPHPDKDIGGHPWGVLYFIF